MQDTILHSGALVVALDSRGEATSAIAGKLPTLDDIARSRAVNRYLDDEVGPVKIPETYEFTQSDQVYLDSQGEL